MEWRLAFATAVIYACTLVLYRLFFHPLARFPGPRLAAVTRWYEAYYDIVLGGQYTFKIAKLHKVYGTVILDVILDDPAFFETLYRNDGRWDKYPWIYDAFGASTSTLFTSSHDAHKARRNAIAPFFSKPNIASRRSIIDRNISKICKRISMRAGTSVNLGAAISAFVRDTANEYILDTQSNELDQEDFGVELTIFNAGAGNVWRTTKHFRWYGPLLRAIPISLMLKVADAGTKSFLSYLQKTAQNTQDGIASALSPSFPKEAPKTIISAIIHSDLPPNEKSFNRVFEEVATITGAATESVAGILRLALYYVYTDTTILQRLREDIASVSRGTEPFVWRELEQLPYLTSVLMEGMRLAPSIASRATRVTNQDLFYNHWRIPAGTPVGMTTLLMHTDEDVFPDPMRFDPGRWADVTERGASTGPRFAPFSRGTRICAGIHLAWAELYLLLATLIQNFDFEIYDIKPSDFEVERDNFAIVTKAGCNLMTRVSVQ